MIRLNRDDRLALALALLALILVSGELILRLAGSYTATKTGVPDSVSLVLAGDWTNNADIQALGRMLDDFHSLYPYITVESKMTDARGGPGDAWYADAHVVVRTGPPPAESSPFGEYPVAWTGQLWVLASRRAYLTEAFGRLPEEVERLRSGQAGPADLEALLQDAQTAGLSPITLGNSHRWPFLMWLQHWLAATVGPAEASTLPTLPAGWRSSDAEASDPFSSIRPAYNDLLRWKRNGWFDSSAWSEGWARGLVPLVEGRAAFALLSAAQITALPPLAREGLEYLPFPRSPGQSAWTIGSAGFLGLGIRTLPAVFDATATRANRDQFARETAAARLLIRFLSSPGVTTRLSALTGKPFFAWDSATGDPMLVLSAWADAALTPAYETMAGELDPGR